jgi:hypothetical protein
MMKKGLIIFILIVIGVVSQARVFSLLNETVAPYFKDNFGNSKVLQNAFDKSNGSNITIAKTASLNESGEFGLLITAPGFGFRVGIEMIRPSAIYAIQGMDTSLTPMYDFESYIQALIPKAGFDFGLYVTELSRVYLSVSGGSVTANIKNSYNLTAAGQTAFPGIADYVEESTGTSTMYETVFGYEHLLSDTTTFCFELGYRSLKVGQFKYKSDITDIYGTAHAAGDVVLNSDGLDRSLDFSGAFAGLALRFYLGK